MTTGQIPMMRIGILSLRRFSIKQVGVDPTAALRVTCPVPDPGDLDITKRAYSAAEADLLADCRGVTAGQPFEGYAFADVVQAAVGAIKKKAYEAENVSAEEQQAFEDVTRRGQVRWRDTLLEDGKPFAARPLNGIWAAAPYLWRMPAPAGTSTSACTTDQFRRCGIFCKRLETALRDFRSATGNMIRSRLGIEQILRWPTGNTRLIPKRMMAHRMRAICSEPVCAMRKRLR